MKKILFFGLILAGFVSSIFADVIPPDSHYVTRTVVVSNCSQFPEIQLVGYITGPTISGYQVEQIKDNTALTKGYKFNTYKVYAVKTSFIQKAGGISAIDFSAIAARVAPVDIIDPGSYYIGNTKPLASDNFVYRIWGYNSNGRLIVYLAQKTLTFNDGTPAQVTNYTYNP
jgi:hypothetical protein